MPLFDYLKGAKKIGRRFLEKLGRKYEERQDMPGFLAAPQSAYGQARSLLEKEFLKSRARQRLHRGRVHAPKELQDRPTDKGQLQFQDDFFYNGEWVTLVSSWIQAAKYDREKLELSLIFLRTGDGVVVSDVTWAEATEFVRAESHGTEAWNIFLVRGKGNKGKTTKPVRPL